MKVHFLLLGSMISFIAAASDGNMRVINNTNMSAKVGITLPIYSRLDAQMHPIKSQQELQDLLYEAILSNSTQEIMQVVQAGADVNIFKDGKAPLMWATILKKLNSVEILKRCGAVIPCPSNMLKRAILNDSPEEIQNAINAGADINNLSFSVTLGGNAGTLSVSPLGFAVFFERPKSVQALLECGAIIPKGLDQQALVSSPIAYALSQGDIKTALILLKHDKNIKLSTIRVSCGDIFEAVLWINPFGIEDQILEFLQELINHGYDINSSSYNYANYGNGTVTYKSAWVSAICSPFCSVKILQLLMKNGANPNQIITGGGDNCTPLSLAVQNNQPRLVKYLLSVGAELNVVMTSVYPPYKKISPLAYAMEIQSRNMLCDFREMIDFLNVSQKNPSLIPQ